MGVRFKILLVLLPLLLVNSVSAQEINTGLLESFPLHELKTFQFLMQERKSPDELADDPESEEFIRAQLTEQLVEAGFRPVESNPDFVIAFYAKTYLRSSHRVLGYMTYDSSLALGRDDYNMGVLSVDFVSPSLNEAVWSARADKAVNQNNADEVIQEACRKLVKAFGKDAKRQARKWKNR